MPASVKIHGVTTSNAKMINIGSTAPYPATVANISSGDDPASAIQTNSDLQVVDVFYPGGDEIDSAVVTNTSDVEGYIVSGSVTVDQATSVAVASDDFAYLGRWRAGGTANVSGTYSGNSEAMTFVVGKETPLDKAIPLAQDGQGNPEYLTYSLVDSSAQYVSAMRPDGTAEHDVGLIKSADLSVDPNAGSAFVNMNIAMNAYGQQQAADLSASSSMSLSPNSTNFTGNMSVQDTASGNEYSGSASGMLIGTNAERAGLSIGFVHPDFGGVGASAVLDRGANTVP